MTQAQRLTGVLVGSLALGLLAGLWVLSVSTGEVVQGLPDAGDLTRWGLPAARVLRDLSMATAIGALILATFVLPDTPDPVTRRAPMTRVVCWAAVAWAISGFAVVVFSYSELAGIPAHDLSLLEIRFFVTDFPFGKALALNAVLAVVVAWLVGVWPTIGSRLAATVVALIAIWPLATTGHAAGALNHDHAVNSQAWHLLGISLWFGGLIAIVLTWSALGPVRGIVVQRYSRIAGWSFALVALSGFVAALLRIPAWSALASSYGALIITKVVLVSLLGVAGAVQRRRFVERLREGSAAGFGALVAIELCLMGVAVGAGVALGGTPPPEGGDRSLTTSESLLGFPMPAQLDALRWFTTWRIDSLWVPISVLAVVVYLAGVVRLRRRGDRWSIGRSIAWIIGWASVVWATSGAPGVYGDVLFSVHMIQHMTIATTSPILMVLGAPVTLALRAVARREDGSLGPREWLLRILHSRAARLLTHPLVAAALFIGGMIVFYYSGLFELSLRSHTAHNLMVAHFIATGYLFASVLVGIDPGVKRPPYPFRILLVMVTFGFHALFAVSLMSAKNVLAASWFTTLVRPWGASPIDDQQTGASLGWLLGDYPLALIAGALIWSWVRDDHREARRLDRQASRDGERALTEYNAFLGGLQAGGGSTQRRDNDDN